MLRFVVGVTDCSSNRGGCCSSRKIQTRPKHPQATISTIVGTLYQGWVASCLRAAVFKQLLSQPIAVRTAFRAVFE